MGPTTEKITTFINKMTSNAKIKFLVSCITVLRYVIIGIFIASPKTSFATDWWWILSPIWGYWALVCAIAVFLGIYCAIKDKEYYE